MGKDTDHKRRLVLCIVITIILLTSLWLLFLFVVIIIATTLTTKLLLLGQTTIIWPNYMLSFKKNREGLLLISSAIPIYHYSSWVPPSFALTSPNSPYFRKNQRGCKRDTRGSHAKR